MNSSNPLEAFIVLIEDTSPEEIEKEYYLHHHRSQLRSNRGLIFFNRNEELEEIELHR